MVRSNIPSSLTISDNTQISGITGGTAAASKALVLDASADLTSGINDFTVDGATTLTGAVTATAGIADLTSSSYTPVARTATSDGLTTGIIADAGTHQVIAVTSASANNIITLPTPTPGTTLIMYVGANGFELRSDTPASVGIGGGTGAGAESAIAANSLVFIVCVSATSWLGFDISGTTLAAIEAASA